MHPPPASSPSPLLYCSLPTSIALFPTPSLAQCHFPILSPLPLPTSIASSLAPSPFAQLHHPLPCSTSAPSPPPHLHCPSPTPTRAVPISGAEGIPQALPPRKTPSLLPWLARGALLQPPCTRGGSQWIFSPPSPPLSEALAQVSGAVDGKKGNGAKLCQEPQAPGLRRSVPLACLAASRAGFLCSSKSPFFLLLILDAQLRATSKTVNLCVALPGVLVFTVELPDLLEISASRRVFTPAVPPPRDPRACGRAETGHLHQRRQWGNARARLGVLVVPSDNPCPPLGWDEAPGTSLRLRQGLGTPWHPHPEGCGVREEHPKVQGRGDGQLHLYKESLDSRNPCVALGQAAVTGAKSNSSTY